MVAYAATDVLYLEPLADALIGELAAKDRLAWVQEACRLLSQVRPQENHQHLFLKFRGAGRLTPQQLAALEELLQLRDMVARQKDRPLFKIMSNAALLKIAMSLPTDLRRLKATQTLSGKQLDMYGHAIMAALEKALALPVDQLPRYPRQRAPRLSPRIPRRVKAIRAWRDETAARMNIDPALLLNKSLIRDIAVNKPHTMADLRSIPQIHQWQVDAFGEAIIAILKSLS
jgi:ribonuclease D